MAIIYELSPSPELPYRERDLHWPKDQMKEVLCLVIAKDEQRAREIAEAKTGHRVWLQANLTQARQVSEVEYFLGVS